MALIKPPFLKKSCVSQNSLKKLIELKFEQSEAIFLDVIFTECNWLSSMVKKELKLNTNWICQTFSPKDLLISICENLLGFQNWFLMVILKSGAMF